MTVTTSSLTQGDAANATNQTHYFSESTRLGIILFASTGLLSCATTSLIIFLILNVMVRWKRDFQALVRKNQCMVLVLNLFLADLILGTGAAVGLRWDGDERIESASGWCWTQASLLHLGDLASGFFVLALALQALYTFVKEEIVPPIWFGASVVFLWMVAVLLTILGPAKYGAGFFAKAGDWCWISEKYAWERLWLHYIWVFGVEFSTIIIYSGLFINLYRRQKKLRNSTLGCDVRSKLNRTMRLLALYPMSYVLLTLPIALTRMLNLAGYTISTAQMTGVGVLVASCGWIDGLVYTYTRRVFIHDPRHTAVSNTPDPDPDPESQVQLAVLDETKTRPGTSGSLMSKSQRSSFGSKKPRPTSIETKDLKIEATVEWQVFQENKDGTADALVRTKSSTALRQKWYPS